MNQSQNSLKTGRPRKWWLSGLFSYLVPGLGQVYNGQVTRGLLLYCLYSLCGSIFFIICLKTMQSSFSQYFVFLLFGSVTVILLFLLFIIIDAARWAKKQPQDYQLKVYNKWYIYIVVIFISLTVDYATKFSIRDIIMRPYRVPTVSMAPTLVKGDYFLSNQLQYCAENPVRGEIIVFKHPRNEKFEYIKRVIGMPGDTLEIKDKVVYINDVPLEEPYVKHIDSHIFPGTEEPRDNYGPIYIPESYYFFMGDNRDNSLDSRYWGLVERNKLKGKPNIIYFSINSKFPFILFNRIGKRIQ